MRQLHSFALLSAGKKVLPNKKQETPVPTILQHILDADVLLCFYTLLLQRWAKLNLEAFALNLMPYAVS